MSKRSTTATRRCFVAIAAPLSRAAQPLISELASLASNEKYRLRVAPPQNLHITLKFIGDVDADQLGLLDSILRHQCARQDPFSLRCRGLGLFNDSLHLRIDQSEALEKLASRLDEAFTFLGYPRESLDFLPHITLARFHASASAELRVLFLEKYRNREWGDLTVESISLYRSETLPEGARYTPIASYPLVG